jgi:hypothetical protein
VQKLEATQSFLDVYLDISISYSTISIRFSKCEELLTELLPKQQHYKTSMILSATPPKTSLKKKGRFDKPNSTKEQIG